MAFLRRLGRAAAALVLAGGLAVVAHADYPARPIRILSPNPAASVPSVLLRSVTAIAGPDLGGAFVIENKPGGNTFIAMIAAVNAAADGYTLVQTTSATDVLHPILYSKLPYDPDKLTPLAMLGSSPYVLIVPPQLNVDSVAALVQLVKARPGAYNFGSAGVGTGIHLLGAKFAQDAGLQMEHVQFAGSAAAHLSMIRGEVHVYFDVLTSALPRIRDGRVKALAVGTDDRFPGLPEVPTMRESGFPGYDMTAWYALQAPRGTPESVLGRLGDAVNKALADGPTRAQYAAMGMLLGPPGSPQDMARRIAADRAAWTPVVKNLNLSLD
ncbi:Bug family tripartite tricarboxylate transporter substrate binding protein [Pseudorhodoferax sp.]|uniref:Bug family tripartite tricarboxylate transporter substrate binding protein n=1 Tax=Pseudorhodoferax sp. TaxID=1993553 RepID=UPI002DD62FE8|nr:tripartite tricarboxylate transporter substrate binding protein [Pseudorhodoferax sp.]